MDKNEFKTLRVNAGWSMEECAEKLGITRNHAFKLENGRANITLPVEKLMRLMAVYSAKVVRS